MEKIILKTEADDVAVNGKQGLIELAQWEHKQDVEMNGGFDDLPSNYPRSIETYNQAVGYLQEYFDGRYVNINELALAI